MLLAEAKWVLIRTVAAGGGSRLFFDGGMFRVGPESAGAHPGPVCYRKGGHLAITPTKRQRDRPDAVHGAQLITQAFDKVWRDVSAGKDVDPDDLEPVTLRIGQRTYTITDHARLLDYLRRRAVRCPTCGAAQYADERLATPADFRRQQRRCHACGTDIQTTTSANRTLYYCPRCQA